LRSSSGVIDAIDPIRTAHQIIVEEGLPKTVINALGTLWVVGLPNRPGFGRGLNRSRHKPQQGTDKGVPNGAFVSKTWVQWHQIFISQKTVLYLPTQSCSN